MLRPIRFRINAGLTMRWQGVVMEHLSLQIDSDTHAALSRIAREETSDIATLVKAAIKRDLFRRSKAKKAVRTDERLVAPLRALLADDLAFAQNWNELQARLQRKGYVLREAGGGLALHRHPTGEKLAKASDLGYSYSRLLRRFQAPFPGHSHAYLFEN
jgi:hypothetical protein